MIEKAVSEVLDNGIRTADILSPGIKPVSTSAIGAAVMVALK